MDTDAVLEFLGPLLPYAVTIGVAVFASWLTSRFALNRARVERLSTLRLSAYKDLVQAANVFRENMTRLASSVSETRRKRALENFPTVQQSYDVALSVFLAVAPAPVVTETSALVSDINRLSHEARSEFARTSAGYAEKPKTAQYIAALTRLTNYLAREMRVEAHK